MTRARTKKIKEELNGLIEHISNSSLVHDTNLLKIDNALSMFTSF